MSTSEDTVRSLGKLLAEGQGERDAVHIAVIPAVAGRELRAGDRVGIENGRAVPCGLNVAALGIVDPFLMDDVEEGGRFWLYLMPGSITSLRHDWTHPAFPSSTALAIAAVSAAADSVEVAASKAWLRAAAESEGLDYQRVLDTAMEGGNLTLSQDCHLSTDDEFWRHVEIITGRRYDESHRGDVYFSCNCG